MVFRNFFQTLPQKLLAAMVSEKLKDQGIQLSEHAANTIAERIVVKNDNQDVEAFDSAAIGLLVELNLVSSEQDFLEEVNLRARELKDLLPQEIEALRCQTTSDFLKFAESRWPQASEQMANERKAFRTNLYGLWADPFEKYRMLREHCFEFGFDYVRYLRDRPPSGKESLREVMVAGHSRACQIADEILYLMEGGYADGALALSRSLHELAVITMFISIHGEDVAKRFLAHRIVDLRRDERLQRSYLKEMGRDVGRWCDNPVAQKYQETIDEFGKDIRNDYGWAADVLQKRNPKFYEIEKNVFQDNETNNMRYFYRQSSRSIHVRPVNLYSRAGIPVDEPMLLAGPSNIGFSDPGRWSAISLAMITTNLFGVSEPSEDELIGETDFRFAVAFSIVRKCLERTIDSFDTTQKNLDTLAAEEE